MYYNHTPLNKMITKTYNETTTTDDRGRVYNNYLKVKGKRYDRQYTVSITPTEQEQGSHIESFMVFNGTSAHLHVPARWSDKKERLLDEIVASYSDRLAESFTAGAQSQKEATPASLNYVYYLSRDTQTSQLLRELQEASRELVK